MAENEEHPAAFSRAGEVVRRLAHTLAELRSLTADMVDSPSDRLIAGVILDGAGSDALAVIANSDLPDWFRAVAAGVTRDRLAGAAAWGAPGTAPEPPAAPPVVPREVKVDEYRDLIAGVRQAVASLASAVGPDERKREAGWVRKAVNDLTGAVCRTAKFRDTNAAAEWLRIAAERLAAAGV